VSGECWCIVHGGIWHAVRGNFEPPDGVTQIETACYRFVNNPGHAEMRIPECELCFEVTS
jgi:hypothetical protein